MLTKAAASFCRRVSLCVRPPHQTDDPDHHNETLPLSFSRGTVDFLLKPENKEKLVKILTSHVVGKAVMSNAITKMVMDDRGSHPVKPLNGATRVAKSEGGKLTLTVGKPTLTEENAGVATITIADVTQSNGVVHATDPVLLPK